MEHDFSLLPVWEGCNPTGGTQGARTAFEKGKDLGRFALSSNEKGRLFGEGEVKGLE